MPPVRRVSASKSQSYKSQFHSITADNVLDVLAQQAMGFHFGKPKRVGEKALSVVLPILRDIQAERNYTTFPETSQVIVTDSGTINRINLKNSSDQNVFVRSGTMFAGKGTQSRTVTRSAVLFPGMEVALECRCIHASHGIRSGSKFDYQGTIPIEMERNSYDAGYKPRGQSQYWANVAHSNSLRSTSMRRGPGASASRSLLKSAVPMRSGAGGQSVNSSFSSSRLEAEPTSGSFFAGNDNLVGVDTVFTASLDDVLTKVKLHDHQAGIGLIMDKGVETIEVFDFPMSWAALHKDSVKRMGTELIKEEQEDVFECKPERAIDAVTRVLGGIYEANTIYEHKATDKNPAVTITGLTSVGYLGEVVELDGNVIHLSLLKRGA